MSLTKRVAIYIQGAATWVHLPPWRLDVNARERVAEQSYDLAQGATIVKARVSGYDIDVQGVIKELTPTAARLFKTALTGAFNSGAKRRLVDIQIWDDDDETPTLGECYRDCQLTGIVDYATPRHEWAGSFSFSLISKLPTIYQTVTGGGNAPEGPYEQYLYGGAEAAATVRGYDVMNVAFEAGIAEVTTADNAAIWQRVMIPSSDRPFRVTGIMQVGCSGLYGTGGATVARVSDTDHATAGNYLECSAAYDQAQSAKATGGFYMVANAPLYLYLAGTGGHNIPVFQINIEVM